MKKWEKVISEVTRVLEEHDVCENNGVLEGCSVHKDIQSVIGLLRLKFEVQEDYKVKYTLYPQALD